jgi:hypothetical protein
MVLEVERRADGNVARTPWLNPENDRLWRTDILEGKGRGIMRPRMRSAWIAAGLAVLGTIIAGGEARAGKAGITINPGGIKPGTGEPPWFYFFDVYLDPGFEVKASGSPLNFFEVGSSSPTGSPTTPLVGVGTDSPPPTQPTAVQWVPTLGTETVTWTLHGKRSVTNAGTSEMFLGQFLVETDKSFPKPPVAPGTIIDYNFRVIDLATKTSITGSNSFTLVSIPEPSSVVMLAAGAAVMAVVVIRGRRRAARPA